MIEEWFCNALIHYRHRSLDSLNSLRGARYLGIDPVLRRLEIREEMRHIVRFQGSTETAARASEIKALVEETEIPFERDWTSFRCDDELVFAFRSVADAVRFRMLWG